MVEVPQIDIGVKGEGELVFPRLLEVTTRTSEIFRGLSGGKGADRR